MALGADAVYIGTGALIGLNCNAPLYLEDYQALGTAPGYCHHCHTGLCPVGITTQDPELMKRLEIEAGPERIANLLLAMTIEIQWLARSCGKADVHDLEPEDMRALTLEASMICGIPLAGTRLSWCRPRIWKIWPARAVSLPVLPPVKLGKAHTTRIWLASPTLVH
jgi:hypothetical protein